MAQLPRIVRIARRKLEAEDIVSLKLVDPAGDPLQPFSAGSHIDVELGPDLIRQYSISSNPADRTYYEIAVLKEQTSRGGSAAVFALTEGQSLRISEPRNRFPLHGAANRSVLFAGGIGITPLLCMAERLHVIESDFELHYCTRLRRRTAYFDRIRQSAFADRVHFYFDEAGAANGLKIDRALGEPANGAHVYVCGPAGFIEFVCGAAERRGYDPTHVHREYFGLSQPIDHGADAPFQIRLASTGQIFDIPSNRSVIEVLRDNGVDLPISCSEGFCGTCLTRLLHGIPDHRDVYLTDAEHEQNDQFTPCCSRAKTPLLVLDL